MLSSLRGLAVLGGSVAASARSASGQRSAAPQPVGKSRILIDTDAGNDFDDQFALAYAALSRESIQIEATCAAPFVNRRVRDPGDGMERSYDEIGPVLEAVRIGGEIPVFKGAKAWTSVGGRPVASPAAEHIVERVMGGGPAIHYLVAIGAPTNVAAALRLEPQVGSRTTVVWLGGTPHHFASAEEFNLRQDLAATRALFDWELYI